MKQRFLKEMESNKNFVPVPIAAQEPLNKNINIFYSSFTAEPEKHEDEKLTRKQEQILRNFQDSKSFRLKAYFLFNQVGLRAVFTELHQELRGVGKRH